MDLIKLNMYRFADLELTVKGKDEASSEIKKIADALDKCDKAYAKVEKSSEDSLENQNKAVTTYQKSLRNVLKTAIPSLSNLANSLDISPMMKKGLKNLSLELDAGKYNKITTGKGSMNGKEELSAEKAKLDIITKISQVEQWIANEENKLSAQKAKNDAREAKEAERKRKAAISELESIKKELVAREKLEQISAKKEFSATMSQLNNSWKEANKEADNHAKFIEKDIKAVETLLGKMETYKTISRSDRINGASSVSDMKMPDNKNNIAIGGRLTAHQSLYAALEKENTTWWKIKNIIKTVTGFTDENTEAVKKNAVYVNNGGKAWDSWSKKLTFWLVRFRVIKSAIRNIASTIMTMVKTAGEYQEALNLYTVALGEYAEEGTRWAKRIEDALYLDPTQIMQYTGAFYNLVQGLGVANEQAFLMSKNLTQLTYDMSSYLNIGVDAAQAKIQSAITGQARAVATAGIAMQIASLQELAYSMGIKKNVTDMTQAEKTYLRYIQLMKGTAKMQKDLGRTIITPSNAIRTIETQFKKLARAIGNIFIPIVLKVIPYVMALTQILNDLASKLAAALGFKLSTDDIDYSGLTNLDTELEDIDEKTKNTGKGIKDTINRTLAAFDDLNVVESESNGNGSGGGGDDDSIIEELKKYIDGYDMLEDLTEEFAKKTAEAKKNLEKLVPALKIITGAVILTKLGKLVKGISNLWDGFKNLSIVKKVAEWFSPLITRFKTAFDISKAFGNNGLVALYDGFRNVASTFNPLVTGLGLIAIGLKTMSDTSSEAYDYFMGRTQMSAGEVAKFTGEMTLLSTAAGLLAGPAGVLVVLAGLIAGTGIAAQRAKEDMAWEAGYDTLFDGVGRSVHGLVGELDGSFGKITEYNSANDTLKEHVDKASAAVELAKQNVKLLSEELALQDTKPTQEQINKLKDAYNNLKLALEEQIDAEKEQELARIDQLHELAKTSEEEYKRQKQAAIDTYTTEKLLTSEYADKLSELEIKKAQGLIKDKEYEEQLQTLKNEYYGINGELDNATDNLQSYMDIQSAKWDLSNFDNTKEGAKGIASGIQEIIDKTNEYKEAENKRYQSTKEDIENDKLNTEIKIKNYERLKEAGKELSKSQQKDYDNLSEKLKVLNTDLKDNETAHKTTISTLEGTLKSFLLSVGSQIDTSSSTFDISNRNLKEVLATIKEGLNEIKNADTKNAIEPMFESMDANIQAQNKKYSNMWKNTMRNCGKVIIDDFNEGAKEEMNSPSSMKIYENGIIKMTEDSFYHVRQDRAYNQALKDMGGSIPEGIAVGINNSGYYLENQMDKTCSLINNAGKKGLEINSPSHVFQRQGASIIEGLVKGIDDNTVQATNAVNGLGKKLQTAFDNKKLNVSISTNVENSFNSILTKLQSFCNKWKDAINTLAKNTKTTMNGIKVDTDGKVTYTKMPSISVAKFEDGGFPTRGDFFFANENGNAEFITSIGNRTAVANQDQMVQALTNAIISGFASLNTNDRPINNTVYIGNKKVYEGQSQYQNREFDRYGTSSILKV